MKTKLTFMFAVLLCMAAACNKNDTPDPKPEPVKKYLSKVFFVADDSTLLEIEHCTWDSLHRLKTYRSNRLFTFEFVFHYDSIGRVARIDHFSRSLQEGPKGQLYYYLCDWKNEKELKGIDIYGRDIINDTLYHYYSRHAYSYDNLGRNTTIERYFSDKMVGNIIIEWEGYNIITAGSDVNNQKFDDKHSPWSTFPDILIAGIFVDSNIKLVYNTSKNNPIQGGGFYALGEEILEYDYDEYGYPLRQYYLQEDGSKQLMYTFEYY